MTVAPEKGAPQAGEPDDIPEDHVRVTIDGFETHFPKGTLIIRAAEELGIQIPRFCDHPLLDPVGACRQCLVEVPDMGNGRGMPKPAASCTTTVMPGMVIKTQLSSPIAEKAQRGAMELLLINHPLDCPICDKGGECPLQNQAMSNGSATSRFNDVKRTFPKPIAISSQVLLDRERCVLCARCTRFSTQVSGDPFIEMFERGALQQVAIYTDEPYESYFSGNVVQICPVGALTGASYRFRSRPFDLVSTPSVCEHCASGCAQRTDWRRGKVMRRLSGDDPVVNEEWNCDKGRWAFTYASSRERILSPMVREDGELVETSWPEALVLAADGLRAARDAGGVGVLPGGRLTVEDAYAYSKFARVALSTNDVDMRARPHSDEEAQFLASSVTRSTVANGGVTYYDLEHASTVLLAGFEPEEESPIVFLRLRKASRAHATRIVSIAPFATKGLIKCGGAALHTVPGDEAMVLTALGAAGGVHADTAALLREPGAIILVGERLATVPGALSAAAALAASSGARLAWIPRRAGERGAIDAGALPTLLPGGRSVDDLTARTEIAQVWGAEVPAAHGRDTTEILTAAACGELAGLLIGGVDIADLPSPELGARALAAAGFVVSLEQRHSSVTAFADVVLPVAPAVHKSGTFVDWEGRARPFPETVRSTGAMTDSAVLDAVAAEMDVALGVAGTDAVRAELATLSATVTPAAHVPAIAPVARTAPSAGQAVLATWHHLLDLGTLQEGDDHLAGTARHAVIRLSPVTAAEIGAEHGSDVTVATVRGSITLPLSITEMSDRVVWLPTRSVGSAVRAQLGVDAGTVVLIAAGVPADQSGGRA